MKIHIRILPLVLIVSILVSFFPNSTFAASLKIIAINDLNTSAYVNQNYSLPKMVQATMSNKSTQNVTVTWNPKTAVTSKAGTFLFKGTVKGYAKQVLLTLTVLLATAVEPRVVVNGKVNEVSGYMINGEYYFKPQDIAQVMSGSSKPFTAAMIGNKTITAASATVGNVNYIKIQDVAKAMNFSYTNDTVLGAVYIWTDLFYDVSTEEITRAEKDGFVPSSLQNNLSKQITFKEFCQMLRSIVNVYNPKLVPKWDTIAKDAAVSNIAMTRGDGMTTIFEAAVVMGLNTFNTDWGTLNNKIGTKCWNEIYNRNSTLFTNMMDKGVISDNPDFTYWAASYFYSFGRKSMVTDKTLFDYDEKANSMHPDKAFTREDAIKAVIRLYESPVSTEKMVSLSEIGTYDKSIITDKLLSYAKEMPEPTAQKLPYYTGFHNEVKGNINIDGVKYDQATKSAAQYQWYEKDVRMVSEWGFNYLRVTEDYEYLFDENDGERNEIGKQTLENAAESWVTQCNENGVTGLCNEIALSQAVDSPDVLKYLADVTSTFKKYGIGWVDYGFASYCGVMNNNRYGVKPVPYNGYLLDVDMLKTLQKYQ